ncbi:MAG: hypothetical protein KAR13_02045, partial [Desulfobulbaceae bacterium]|nr:hypothetical protein [Desulfobulbaceae bacterium]
IKMFEDDMMAHSKKFSPRLCEVIGDEQLRVALRQMSNDIIQSNHSVMMENLGLQAPELP